MSTEIHRPKRKSKILAQIKCGMEVQAIGVVVENGTVSLHGYEARYELAEAPTNESHRGSESEKQPLIFFEVKTERLVKSFVDHYQKPRTGH